MSGAPREEPNPWRDSRFRTFAAGNSLNNIGESVYDVALPLLAYDLTGSLALMGVLAALTPATLLLGPLFGSIADRWGSRVLVVPGLVVQMSAALLINLLALRPGAPLWLLVVLAGILQVAGAAYRVGWMTGVPRMFPNTPVRSRGTLSSLFVATTIVGPIVVSAALTPIGYRGLLWINLATFAAPIFVWLIGVHPPRHQRPDQPRRFDLGVVDGWKVIRQRPSLLAAHLVILPLDLILAAATPTLATYHLRDTIELSPQHVAIIFGAMNVAALIGSLGVSQRRYFRPGQILAITTIGLTLALVTASVQIVAVVVMGLIVLRLAEGATEAASAMLTVHYVPAEYLGRTSGLTRLVHGVPSVAAPLLLVPLVPVVGTSGAFLLLGLIGLLPLLLLIRLRRVSTGAERATATDPKESNAIR